MFVGILDVSENLSKKRVEFLSEFGNAIAYWEGREPLVNSNYHVEIDIDGILSYGVEIKISEGEKCLIRIREDSMINIIGLLESVDAADDDGYDDDCATVRLEKYIFTFCSHGLGDFVGRYIDITVPHITLFQYDL